MDKARGEKTTKMKEYDIYRDSYLRYLGYTNEVGEAFRPLVPRYLVNLGYVVATGYVCADALDKSLKIHERGGDSKQIAMKASDVFIWQMMASVIIPGFTINRITWLSGRVLRQGKFKKQLVKTIPTVLGLVSIPFIIHPIDNFADFVMDKTFRKWIT